MARAFTPLPLNDPAIKRRFFLAASLTSCSQTLVKCRGGGGFVNFSNSPSNNNQPHHHCQDMVTNKPAKYKTPRRRRQDLRRWERLYLQPFDLTPLTLLIQIENLIRL